MLKKCLIVAAFAALAGCGPSQPPADQNAANPPPAAAAAPPAAAPAAAPAPAPADDKEAQIREQERKLARLKREEADLQARNQAAQVAQNTPPAPPPCQDCGVVASITPVRQTGQAGLVGTLGGAAAGGLAGSQFGKGKGNTAMTVLGVVGGALAGREVEKQVNATTVYQVTVNMQSGGTQTVTINSVSGLAVGSRVHVNGNNLMPY